MLKALVARHRVLQHVYASALRMRAGRQLKGRQRYDALETLCAACRRIGSPDVTTWHWDAIRSIVRSACYSDGKLLKHQQNKLVSEFARHRKAAAIRREFAAQPLADRVRLRKHRDDQDPGRQGHMIILKAPQMEMGQRGVLALNYNATFEQLAAVFKLKELLRYYRVVLEPSYSRNYLASLFLYVGSDLDVLVQCSHAEDYQFVEQLGLNLVPIRLGAADWVDDDVFQPAGEPRTFDVVMVASWSRMKRHRVLFRALGRLKPREFRFALVGYPDDLTAEDLRRQMRRLGLAHLCTLYERISPREVARVLARSKVAVHLSKQEGTNRATYEALFCDTPVIVYRHNIGFNMQAINSRTGRLADDDELPGAIAHMVDHYRQFEPRRWALEHTGYRRSTERVNQRLRALAEARGEPWTRDIAAKINCPNYRYKHEADRLAFEPAYEQLLQLLHEGAGGNAAARIACR